MKAHPFLIKEDASGEGLQPIEGRDEAWLQEILRSHPDILPVAEIEPVFYPLVPIGREVAVEVGAIDNLFISHRGYLVLVETKLWRNPEAKREVVAQAIDYGSAISKWSYSKLDDVVKKYTDQYEHQQFGLADWVEQQRGPVEAGREFFEETVAKNLRLGRFLILIVGDRIRQSVIEMLDYVNKYPHLAAALALVQLNCYKWKSKSQWPLLVVPNIIARTQIVERSVIQVTLKREGNYDVDVRQEGAGEKGKGRVRLPLAEDAFWELLREQAPDWHETARRLIDRYREREGITIEPGEGSIVVRLDVLDTGQQVSTFFIDKYAYLHCWPGTVGNQLARAGLNPSIAESYEIDMRKILKKGKQKQDFARPIGEVNHQEFADAADAFIQKVQLAEPNE
jgi:hypothetical protein